MKNLLSVLKVCDEIFYHGKSLRRHDGFRVKLESVNRIALMRNCHDFTVLCAGGDIEFLRQRILLNGEGMVS